MFYQTSFLDRVFELIEALFNASSSFASLFPLLSSLIRYGVEFLLPLAIACVVLHALFSLPLRRRERARLFLDLIESSLAQGRSVEHTIVSIAESRDRAVGVRFYLLAAHIESGMRFSAALEKVPRFLPPQISRILRVGEKLGDLSRVLPACRESLREPSVFVKSAIHYIFILLLAFSFVAILLTSVVLPKTQEILSGMAGSPSKIFPLETLLEVQFAVVAILSCGALIYIGGPRLVRWFRFRELPFVDWIAWRIPWKQKQLQKTFSAMLAVLLDGGVPEKEAVQLAGDCTANTICQRRSRRVIEKLENGIKLDEAVRAFDHKGEFHWRLRNAIHAKNGFLDALRGWHETLAARAFQQEEAAAHIFTCVVIILNGATVASVAIALFGSLISILDLAAL
jgi:type II secretory pathway component PulF